jgi:hypothetical protein
MVANVANDIQTPFVAVVAFLNSSTFCGEFQHWWTVNHKFFFVLNIYVVQKCDE